MKEQEKKNGLEYYISHSSFSPPLNRTKMPFLHAIASASEVIGCLRLPLIPLINEANLVKITCQVMANPPPAPFPHGEPDIFTYCGVSGNRKRTILV